MTCPSCGSAFHGCLGSVARQEIRPAKVAARKLERIAQFELIELLGEGAFGAVWKAHDTRLDRTVALKILRPRAAFAQ